MMLSVESRGGHRKSQQDLRADACATHPPYPSSFRLAAMAPSSGAVLRCSGRWGACLFLWVLARAGEFGGRSAGVAEGSAHPNEGAHDVDTHLHGPSAVEDVGGHD